MTAEPSCHFDAGGALRRLRRALDLSQRELARRAGVSATTIAAIETGARSPSLTLLARVLACGGLRLVAVEESGAAVAPMPADTVRAGTPI